MANNSPASDEFTSVDGDDLVGRERSLTLVSREAEPLKQHEGEDAEAAESSSRDTQCGVLGWRPACLQPFATIWVFTATISAYNVFGGINFSYYSAVITSIEKRFGLSSAMTGFIKNIDNFGFMISVIVVSHFCRYANKPRLFAVAAIVNAVAIFMFALPHFLYDNPNATVPVDQVESIVGNQTIITSQRFEMCDGYDSGDAGKDCQSSTRPADFQAGALGLFVASELIQGMAVAPKYTMSVTYLDDNAQDQPATHFGVMFGIRALSPLLGYLLGAWTTSIYVDLSDPGIDEKDPRWVGAWWIGFVLCGLGTIVWAIPLVLFPPRIKGAPVATEDDDNILDKTKDLPKAVVRLAKNPVYVCCLIGGCFNMSLVGFSTFIPKYLEYQFGVTASTASIYTGIIGMFSWGIGPVISGVIMSKTHMRVSGAMKFTCLIQISAIFCYIIATFIKCPDADWAESFNFEKGLVDAPCNSKCSCDPTLFNPVCGADNLIHYSPCYAGCIQSVANTSQHIFENCSCIIPPTPSDAATARLGLCPKSCLSMYFYMATILIAGFATSMIIVPVMTTLLRCVDEKDKAMGLAFSFALTQLLGFPAPIIYGRVIDSTCLVKQASCSRQGACLYYNNDQFRLRYHWVTLALKIGAIIMYGLSWYFNRKKDNLEARSVMVPTETQPDGSIIDKPVRTMNGDMNKSELMPVSDRDKSNNNTKEEID